MPHHFLPPLSECLSSSIVFLCCCSKITHYDLSLLSTLESVVETSGPPPVFSQVSFNQWVQFGGIIFIQGPNKCRRLEGYWYLELFLDLSSQLHIFRYPIYYSFIINKTMWLNLFKGFW